MYVLPALSSTHNCKLNACNGEPFLLPTDAHDVKKSRVIKTF